MLGSPLPGRVGWCRLAMSVHRMGSFRADPAIAQLDFPPVFRFLLSSMLHLSARCGELTYRSMVSFGLPIHAHHVPVAQPRPPEPGNEAVSNMTFSGLQGPLWRSDQKQETRSRCPYDKWRARSGGAGSKCWKTVETAAQESGVPRCTSS